MVDPMVDRLEDLMVGQTVDRLEGPMVDRTVGRLGDLMEGRMVGLMVGRLEGLMDPVARTAALRTSSAESIRFPALLEPFQARGFGGCESLLLEAGGPLLLGQLEVLVLQVLPLQLGEEGHLKGV